MKFRRTSRAQQPLFNSRVRIGTNTPHRSKDRKALQTWPNGQYQKRTDQTHATRRGDELPKRPDLASRRSASASRERRTAERTASNEPAEEYKILHFNCPLAAASKDVQIATATPHQPKTRRSLQIRNDPNRTEKPHATRPTPNSPHAAGPRELDCGSAFTEASIHQAKCRWVTYGASAHPHLGSQHLVQIQDHTHTLQSRGQKKSFDFETVTADRKNKEGLHTI